MIHISGLIQGEEEARKCKKKTPVLLFQLTLDLSHTVKIH